MSHDELPEGWATAALSELLVALETGSRPPGGVRGISEGVPSIGAEHLTYDGKFDFTALKYVPQQFAARMTRGRINTGDILMVKDGATTAKTTFVDSSFPFRNAFVNEHVFICRPLTGIEPRFVFRFLMSKQGQDRILASFKGAAQGGINQSFAAQTEIPVAPLAEQSRIAGKLEQLIGRAQSCEEQLANIPVLLKRFAQSVLVAACAGRLTTDWREASHGPEANTTNDDSQLPAGWTVVNLGDVIADGPDNGLYKPSEFYGSGAPIVRIDSFYDGTIAPWDQLKRIRVTKAEQAQFALRNGDVLINRVNSPKFLGKAALVRELIEPCVYESNMMRVRFDNSRVDPEFAITYLRSAVGLRELQKNAKHAVNQSSINQKDVKGAQFVLPPLTEQKEITRRVAAALSVADKIHVRLSKAHEQVSGLIPSLLWRAYRGELVETEAALARQEGRDYEPASLLLERLQESRATQPVAQVGRKKGSRKAAR